ncbi:Uma2 family endonuclease [Anaerobacterium chartisolvens]|uniref:Uma2 family endonuclease n=1 Tax=Anaerobacterium chartisolvens TaxID=1297424 RepID=A0A369B8I1_9FIRM|nr:Uma2 family endonuclease [Anaerobacterium chartisolvens]RCX16847.1 Uma2 family endonuclease [Anaerobacterium chartisolvens]
MPLPNQERKYTYADYLTWPEGERWEIIDGVPYMQAAPLRIHQEISMELSTQLHTYLKGKTCRVFAAPFCVRLDVKKADSNIKNVVEPDITIVCDSSKLDERGCSGSPDMIIEILSPASGKIDKLIKFNKYEKAGVKEYWIVEPDQKLVSVFILQSNGSYGRPEIYSEENKITVSIFPDLNIDLKPVFDRE